eukprot:CAMPEP_0201528768 /NCGR_PEP_ID=MMETSP0161_2-20130828/39498_1 /ASSEMBLY_ACC=CAM_ASM_000251 /TAXON_ID=180227 /ORGANISM="Neoparamoeba aestuarina, Strain SoJaBio B1-5/56/2" /LENGTH=218 /DNA_ID=CAMNT_0047930229 /DNA_START=131 /DNA_END=783 /DNA_ORIENTATION=-
MTLLNKWLHIAKQEGHSVSRGFILATSTPEEGPTARTVVCRVVCEETGAITFGSCSESQKGRALKEDSRAEAVFRWGTRQIRLRGRAFVDDEATRKERLQERLSLHFLNQGLEISEHEHARLLAVFGGENNTDNPTDAMYKSLRKEERVSLHLLNQGFKITEEQHAKLLAALKEKSEKEDPRDPPPSFRAYRLEAATCEFYQQLHKHHYIVDRFLYVR